MTCDIQVGFSEQIPQTLIFIIFSFNLSLKLEDND